MADESYVHRIPALEEYDLDPLGKVVLEAIEECYGEGLLYGGDGLDPLGWSMSTFPEAARRIALAVTTSTLDSVPQTVTMTPASIARRSRATKEGQG